MLMVLQQQLLHKIFILLAFRIYMECLEWPMHTCLLHHWRTKSESNLMCTGVCSKEKTLIDIKVVRLFSADMIFRNKQGIKVLLCCDHWVQLTVDGEERVASWWEVPSIHVLGHALGHMTQGMVRLQVEVMTHVRQQVRGYISHVISCVLPAQHHNLRGT